MSLNTSSLNLYVSDTFGYTSSEFPSAAGQLLFRSTPFRGLILASLRGCLASKSQGRTTFASVWQLRASVRNVRGCISRNTSSLHCSSRSSSSNHRLCYSLEWITKLVLGGAGIWFSSRAIEVCGRSSLLRASLGPHKLRYGWLFSQRVYFWIRSLVGKICSSSNTVGITGLICLPILFTD